MTHVIEALCTAAHLPQPVRSSGYVDHSPETRANHPSEPYSPLRTDRDSVHRSGDIHERPWEARWSGHGAPRPGVAHAAVHTSILLEFGLLVVSLIG